MGEPAMGTGLQKRIQAGETPLSLALQRALEDWNRAPGGREETPV